LIFFCEVNLEIFSQDFHFSRLSFHHKLKKNLENFSLKNLAFFSLFFHGHRGFIRNDTQNTTMNHDVDEDNKWCQLLLVGIVAATAFYACTRKKFVVDGRRGNRCDPDYGSILTKVMKLKINNSLLFTRMFGFLLQPLIKPLTSLRLI
jgi:hypothetical protein